MFTSSSFSIDLPLAGALNIFCLNNHYICRSVSVFSLDPAVSVIDFYNIFKNDFQHIPGNKSMGWFLNTIAILAILYFTVKLLSSLFRVIYPFFIARPKDLHKLAGAKWAVVTGASDGIGKEYAMQLAKRGFNLVLIARSLEKLKAASAEIEGKFPDIEAKVIVYDFTYANVDLYKKKIFDQIDELNIGILVNNVGAISKPGIFHENTGGMLKIADNLIVNTVPHTLLTAFVLRQMTARKSGIIINISSLAGTFQYQYAALYSSVKKYFIWLMAILRKEYKGSGVTIQTICPGIVCTKILQEVGMRDYKPTFFTPSSEVFVQQALRTVGHMQETTGYVGHQLQLEAFYWVPDFILTILHKKRAEQLAKNNRPVPV